MPSPVKTITLAAVLVAATSAAILGQQPAASPSASQTMVVNGNIDWMEKSNVAAMREGVVKQIEYQLHDRVERGEPIGYLRDEMAILQEARAKVAANSTGAVKRAEAQKSVAMNRLARAIRLEQNRPGSVTAQERQELEAEVIASDAAVEEAKDNQRLAQAELDLAQQAVKDHVITAPFTGYITDKWKNQGEAVQANEAIVSLGRVDRLRFHGYVPLEDAYKISVGDLVEVRPIIDGVTAPLAIQNKVFRGKVQSLSREVIQVRLGSRDVQVIAEIADADDPDNPELSLRPGMQSQMTIRLGTGGGPPVATVGGQARAEAR